MARMSPGIWCVNSKSAIIVLRFFGGASCSVCVFILIERWRGWFGSLDLVNYF